MNSTKQSPPRVNSNKQSPTDQSGYLALLRLWLARLGSPIIAIFGVPVVAWHVEGLSLLALSALLARISVATLILGSIPLLWRWLSASGGNRLIAGFAGWLRSLLG